jgi:vacuolar-type H+-ATPase subunit C/Vma6
MKVGIVGNMTKLEQKLIELGYVETLWEKGKWNSKNLNIVIFTNEEVTKIEYYYVWANQIRTQNTIDYIQVSFDKMQKDLEILKECEDNES